MIANRLRRKIGMIGVDRSQSKKRLHPLPRSNRTQAINMLRDGHFHSSPQYDVLQSVSYPWVGKGAFSLLSVFCRLPIYRGEGERKSSLPPLLEHLQAGILVLMDLAILRVWGLTGRARV